MGGAERIRSLILLRATCEKVLDRLEEDDIDDVALAVQINDLCDTIADALDRVPHRRPPTGPTSKSA